MPSFQKEKNMNDIETSEITTSPRVRALIVAGAAGGTGTGFWSQAKHFDNALLEKIEKRYYPAQDGH
jgi:hypothetical protein